MWQIYVPEATCLLTIKSIRAVRTVRDSVIAIHVDLKGVYAVCLSSPRAARTKALARRAIEGEAGFLATCISSHYHGDGADRAFLMCFVSLEVYLCTWDRHADVVPIHLLAGR